MTGRPINATVPGERAKEFGRLFDRARSGVAVEDAPAGLRTKGGQPLDVLVSLAPIPDAAGRPLAVVVIVEIAAEAEARRQAETALLESDGRWRAVIPRPRSTR